MVIVAITTALACNQPPAPVQQTADTIYIGGDIVTVNDAQATVEALAVKDGKTGDRPRRSSTFKAARCSRASSTPTGITSARSPSPTR
jgi:hypothetical protein